MLQGIRLRLLSVLIAAVASNLNLQAEPLRPFSTHGYVNDFANVLDSSSSESLDELCYRLEHWTDTQLNVVTVQSVGGHSSQNYALRVFNEQNDFPEAGKRRIVLLFGSQERKMTIIAGAEVRQILSAKVRQYQRELAPYLRRHQDGQAIAFLTNRIAEDIAADAQVGLKEVNGYDYRALGGWAPVAQPYDILVRSLRVMIILWSVVIVGIALVKRLRRSGPGKPELTFLVIGNEPCKDLTS